jgi:hypothetical protein
VSVEKDGSDRLSDPNARSEQKACASPRASA